jgi:hypothetical protein
MDAHAVFLARDLARVRRGHRDRCDADGVAGLARLCADDDEIAELQPGVAGELRVDRDGAGLMSLRRARRALRA